MTQTQIAQKVGISQQFVSKIFAGKSRPSWRVAKKLAEITNTTPVLWLEGTPEQIKQALEHPGKNRRKGPGRRKTNGINEDLNMIF